MSASQPMSTNSTLDHASQLRVKVLALIFLGISAALIGGVIAFLGELAYALLYFSLVFAVIIFANYRNGIWLLTLLLPFASTQLVPRELFGVVGLNPFNILFVLTLLSLFAASAFRREDIQFVSLPTTFWIYVGVVTLGAYVGVGSVEREIVLPNSEPLTKTTYLLDAFFKPLMILAVAWLAAVLSRNGNGRSVIWALAPAYITFFFVIAGYLVGNGISLQGLVAGDREFLNWTGLHANDVGELANIGLAILLFTALASSAPWSRAILLACAGAAATTAALTFSRAAFVGIGIILGYYVWKQRSVGRFLLALSAIVTVALLLPDAFFERASTGLATGDEQAITAGRLDEIWRPLIGTFWEAPIIGHGLYSTLWATPNLRGAMLPVGQAHSAYLDVALDLGIVGIVVVAAFFWSVWTMFRDLSKHHIDPQWRGVFEGCTVCLLFLAIQGFTNDRFTPTPPQAALWLCYGLALGQAQSTRSIKRAQP
ncbi:O-antigen ligase family protein [Bradyrhizobium sp. CB1650]|uniref:O-antigen ligase family protein n=1 Tax=Bradyrhizobium sp. CB1650 TaxID=3039153 RepID=UPI0024352873|nr:O-antigen ligase family protein [Bradyrhizobium sp. CB1650]WGD54980.1 O-antigen ligase family protein [Bradyrhizobium sp. CB1650]